MKATDSTTSHTIVFIHGMWMTAQLGELERPLHRSRPPRACSRVARPRRRARAGASRSVAAEGARLKEIVDHYDTIIRGLDRPPIIIGHSFGGSIAAGQFEDLSRSSFPTRSGWPSSSLLLTKRPPRMGWPGSHSGRCGIYGPESICPFAALRRAASITSRVATASAASTGGGPPARSARSSSV